MKFLRLTLFISIIFLWACSKSCSTKTGSPESSDQAAQEEMKKKRPVPDYRGITVDRVVVRELKPGTGAQKVKANDKVRLTYTAWIYNPAAKGNRGPEVLSAKGEERTVTEAEDFPKGLAEGLIGMRIGAERTLIIPKELAFGSKGLKGKVPADAILLVNVTVNKIL